MVSAAFFSSACWVVSLERLEIEDSRRKREDVTEELRRIMEDGKVLNRGDRRCLKCSQGMADGIIRVMVHGSLPRLNLSIRVMDIVG